MLKTSLTLLAGTAVALVGFANINTAKADDWRHHPRPHHYDHHHHHAGKVLGYSLLGAGVGYLIYKAGQNSGARQYNEGYTDGLRDSRTPPQVIVVPPAGRDYAEGGPYGDSSFDFNQCKATRRYETTIYVDGEPEPAYGTACLTYDGRWIAGPLNFGR